MANNTILVSGVGVPDFAIPFPSGQIDAGYPGSNLYAFLASANANFGFNLTPNTLEMNFMPVPRDETIYHGASGNLPTVGMFLEMFIEDFYFRGRINHADYNNSDAGTIIRITLEDTRRSLDKIKIHTEDLGDNVPSGVVSIGRAYRILHGLTDDDGAEVDGLVFEYNEIMDRGATYSQIIEALQLAINERQINLSINQVPPLSKLEANIGGTIEALRFKFDMTSLTEAITTVLQDCAYDWYWNMNTNSVSLINRKAAFELTESNLMSLINKVSGYSDVSEGTKRLGFGEDAVQEPTRFRLLGGRQQGFINSELLSPVDGLDTSSLDNNVTFVPAWSDISVGFYDADGFYRTYTPTDKELQMALAGIEHWTYFKIYQSEPAPDGFGLASDVGSIAAQHSTFQSRFDPSETLADMVAGSDADNSLRIINNRRDEEHNWVNDFFNRVNNHAQRHFGRSYVAEGIAYNESSGLFKPIDAAWCNIENQIEGQSVGVSGSFGPFVDDYEINRLFGPVAPFLTDDFRVSAHCVLPPDTRYGADGDQAPASFSEWTEDAPPFNPSGNGYHYIPCSISVVGRRVKNPRSDDLYSFEDYPDGTLWVQLPTIAGSKSEDSVLANLSTLIELSRSASSQGLFDVANPAQLIEPYSSLSGVAIPVESRIRYGQNFPSQWVLGDEHYQRGEDVVVDDAFVPWGFYPVGNDTSLEVMTNRAVRKVQGRFVDNIFSRYADISQVGLPTVGFDSFADQGASASGVYGERSHGVTELNIVIGQTGYETRYKIASYFATFGREAPLGERQRTQVNGILHPIDYTLLTLTNPIPGDPSSPAVADSLYSIPPSVGDKKTARRVTITEVNDVFTLVYKNNPALGPIQERYRGKTETGDYDAPNPNRGSHIDYTNGAICVDGFLNYSDRAMYHTDDYELATGNVVYRYFTGGRKFGAGNIVDVKEYLGYDGTYHRYNVEMVQGAGRALINTPLLNGTLNINDKTTLVADGGASVQPGNAPSGVYLNSAGGGGGTPVIIQSITSAGTLDAYAYAQPVNGDLDPDATRSAVSGVPFPYPPYAQTGDMGLWSTTSDGRNVIYVSRLPIRSID